MLTPSLNLDQYQIHRVGNQDVGFTNWAYLSDNVQQRFEMSCRLKPNEWNCGDNIWVVEVLAKNIKVLSPKYIGSNSYVELRCLICNHKWSAKGNAFFNNRRIAGCDKCNRRKAGKRNKLSIQHLQEYAKNKGGQLISSKYVQSQYRYSWKCSQGHAFTGIFSEMKYRKQFCPICEGRQIRSHK
jgi:hypothetical protein